METCAADGDTVNIPAGACTWTSAINITDKDVTIVGAGQGDTGADTIITNNVSNAYNHAAFMVDNDVGYPKDDFEISYMRIIEGITRDTGGGALLVWDAGPDWRVHHCTFISNYAGNMVYIGRYTGSNGGLIDNCTFNATNSGSISTKAFQINAKDLDTEDGGTDPDTSYGSTSWGAASSLGAKEALYIEDCTFNWTVNYAISDYDEGARVVFRYNTVDGGGMVTHGDDSGCCLRGVRHYEIYENEFSCTSNCYYVIFGTRGGTGVIYNNTFSGSFGSGIILYHYCADACPGPCSGWPNPCSYPCSGQIGQGPDDTTDPLYLWSNTFNDGLSFSVDSCASSIVVSGRDYYNEAGAKSGYTAYAYPHPLRGGNYYVQDGGNDSAAGTSSEPWAHCPGLTGWSGSVTLGAGDIVYFDNTDVWTSATGSNLLIPVAGVTYDGSTWGGGTRATLMAGIAYEDAVVTFKYDHPTVPTVIKGFEVDVNDTISTGIAVDWGFAYSELTGATKKIEDCIVHDVYSRSAVGDYKYGIIISTWGGDEIENVEVINCEVYNISRSGILVYLGNDVNTNKATNVLIRGNTVYNTGEDPNSVGSGIAIKNHAIDTVVEYNYVYDVAGGGVSIDTNDVAGFIGPENCTIRYNIIRSCDGRWASPGINVDYSGNKSFDIYGNLIFNNAGAGIRLTDRLDDNLSGRIYNNTFYQNQQTVGSRDIDIQGFDATVVLLEVRNNVIYSNSGITPLYDTDGDITVHSNNLYYRTGGGTLVYTNGTSYTSANLTSWEATALSADPSFKNTSNLPTGFSGIFGANMAPDNDGLNFDSIDDPPVNAGVALGASYNSSINTVTRSGLWDMGSYEYSLDEGNQSVSFGGSQTITTGGSQTLTIE